MQKNIFILFCLAVFTMSLAFAQGNRNNSGQRKITIGMIGKKSTSPIFIATYTGARVAAKELGAKYKVDIVIDWQTPAEENVQEQASTIEKFTNTGVDGIAISCIDANFLTRVIDEAVGKGVPVVCFDSDAPKSKRFAYCGAGDIEFGKQLLKELAAELKGSGSIAVLVGSKNALNLQRRLQGIREELKNYPNIRLQENNVYYSIENPEVASGVIERAYKSNPHISGWILITSTATQIKNTFKWYPGDVKVVAGNAVPVELEYVKSGYIQRLVGVNIFQIGYKSIELLLDKIINNRVPKESEINSPLTQVTKQNVDEWFLNWRKWLIKEAVYR